MASKEKVQAMWNDELVEIFCDLCIQNIDAGRRPGTHFDQDGWRFLVEGFAEKTKKSYSKVQLKNKWDFLKVEYKLWRDLMGKETGLGWDPIKKTIDASEDWWARRLAVVPAAKKFRKKGITPEFEDILRKMFSDTFATGEHSWAPSSGFLPLEKEDLLNENIDLTDEVDISNKEIMVLTNEVEKSNENNRPIIIEEPKNKKRNRSFPTDLGKEKRGKNEGGARKLSNQIDRLCQAMETKNHNIALRNAEIYGYSIKVVMEKLDNLIDIKEETQLYLFATRLFMFDKKREMFVVLKEPESQLLWLKNEYAEHVKQQVPNENQQRLIDF